MTLVVAKDKHILFNYSIIDNASGEIPEQSVALSEVISPGLETGQASSRPLLAWLI